MWRNKWSWSNDSEKYWWGFSLLTRRSLREICRMFFVFVSYRKQVKLRRRDDGTNNPGGNWNRDVRVLNYKLWIMIDNFEIRILNFEWSFSAFVQMDQILPSVYLYLQILGKHCNFNTYTIQESQMLNIFVLIFEGKRGNKTS